MKGRSPRYKLCSSTLHQELQWSSDGDTSLAQDTCMYNIQIIVHHVQTQLDLVLYIYIHKWHIHIIIYCCPDLVQKMEHDSSQVWEPSIVSTKKDQWISALLPGEFPFKVPEANLGAVVVGHRQTPPGSWFHAILHLLWSYEKSLNQLVSGCFGFIWIRFFRILSSKMTRSPPLICWKTSGRALQPSLKPRSSPFSLENKLCEQNQSIKHHIYEDSTSTYIYWHPSKTCSKNALFPSFSCEILTERPAKKVQAVCHGPIGELVENLRRCEYSFARATRMTKWSSNIACKPSNINLHLFGVTSYKASWYSWCGHVQCSEWNTKKYVLCQMIISKNLTLNHTEIHPSVLTLLGSSCPLSLPQTEWQRVEPCEAVMGHGFYENQIGILDLTQRDISLLRNWNVLQLKSQVLISSPELTH